MLRVMVLPWVEVQKSAVGAEESSEGVESPRSGAPKGSIWSRPDGMGTVGTGIRAQDVLGAAKSKAAEGTERGGGAPYFFGG